MPLSDLDQALLELAVERGILTETGVQRVRDAVLAPRGPDVESAIFDLVDGATFQKLCKDLPDFYARRLKSQKPLARDDLAAAKEWFGREGAEAGPASRRIGRYELLRELGRGALGVVHRVREDGTLKHFALKILSHVQDPTASQRFLREVKALSKVDHPNVVRIHDLGEEGGSPYYVMELIEGDALGEVIEKRGPLEPRVAVSVARDLLQGLGAIHAQAIVHRDVKPANILLDASGRAVLIDFSAANLADAPGAVTKEGFSVGTPVYMAPEQIAGEPVGPATDLYALGVSLFVALEGSSPYGPLATYDTLADAKLEAPPPPVRREGVPPGLVRFVERLMATEPGDRYASAAEAVAALDALAGEPGKAPLLLGDFEILETVARGAGATVYRARSVDGAPVALKVLDANASPLALERLTREARALGRVKHANVVSLLRGGLADGRPFLALAWFEGQSLEKLCAKGPLPLETVFALSVQLARGLAAIHEKNVLHRDLRPENVLVANDGPGKWIDFGLAKIEGDEEEAPALVGSPAYASPEQSRGEPSTRRSDLYALGCVLFRMAAGRRPFEGSRAELAKLHSREAPPDLEAIRPEAAPLVPIVASLLAKIPENRHASAALLAADLELLASGQAKPWWKLW